MSEAADFIDAALQYEVSPYSSPADEPDGLARYGTSVGAIRGTIRDALTRYPNLSHDELTALTSELWQGHVFERRQAAIVLLQSAVQSLVANDLTRIEGFIRSAGSDALRHQLTCDVLIPLFAGLDDRALAKARTVTDRWLVETDANLAEVARRLRPPEA